MPHDDTQAQRTLALLAAAIAAAPPATATATADPPPPLAAILADLDACLALVDNTTTKLALALKPPAPDYAGGGSLINDLAQHTAALVHLARLPRGHIHGVTITRHLSSCVLDVINAIRVFAQSFLDNAGEDFVLRTASLHDLITNARSPSGIPKDNQAAVYYAWKSDRDSLDDNLQEIAQLIEQAESPDNSPDDGWDEIGLGHDPPMDKVELDRTKNVHQILRITTLLHKRIFLDLLPYSSSAPSSAFDSLLTQSNLLLSTSDDLVADLYPPQDPDQVRDEILEIANITTSLQSQLPTFLSAPDQLTAQLLALSLSGDTQVATAALPSKKRADKKWFDTCFDQLRRLCSKLTVDIPSSVTHQLAE